MNAITTGGRVIGRVSRVVGPLVQARGVKDAQMLELAEVGADRLVGEIVRLDGERAALQVYEDTTGLKPGEPIYGTGMPLSAELGPGLLGGIFDGIQRPLAAIRDAGTVYPARHPPAGPRPGADLACRAAPAGQRPGPRRRGHRRRPETGSIEHRVLAPPGAEGRITSIAPEGEYRLNDTIAVISGPGGAGGDALPALAGARGPPVRAEDAAGSRARHRAARDRHPLPGRQGGTVVLPGGFGTGKTMLQHALAKWCDAQVIVFIGCPGSAGTR